jgi:hypothetical protein
MFEIYFNNLKSTTHFHIFKPTGHSAQIPKLVYYCWSITLFMKKGYCVFPYFSVQPFESRKAYAAIQALKARRHISPALRAGKLHIVENKG